MTDLQLCPPSSWDVDILTPLSRLAGLHLTGATEPAGGLARLAGRLSHLTHLTELGLYTCRWATDLEPLAQLTSLQRIDIDDTSVTDLAPLANLSRLRWPYIGNTDHVLDLAPLSNLPELKDLLTAAPAPRIDLTPLRGTRTTPHLSNEVKLADAAVPQGVRIRRF